MELLLDTARFCERTLNRELLGMITRTSYAGGGRTEAANRESILDGVNPKGARGSLFGRSPLQSKD